MSDRGHDYATAVAAEVRGMAAKKQIPSNRLAAALGISEMSMSRRMTGKLPFGIDELAAVADALGVRVTDLLPHLDSNQKPAGIQTDAEAVVIPFPRDRAMMIPSGNRHKITSVTVLPMAR